MCGIAGIVLHSAQADAGKVEGATALLRRRGPDDGGVWCEGGTGLGHRRLAILDLTEAGHQPMISPCGRYVVVYNGEIYNHLKLRDELPAQSWRGHSDTETLLAAFSFWGRECLTRLQGMFALAIWDRQERSLFLARDRMGVKPLYYAETPAGLAFASRPKSLLALCPELGAFDGQGLRYYLQCGYFPAEHAAYAGVRKVPPACWLLLEDGRIALGRYWDFRAIAPESSWQSRPEALLLDELDGLLEKAVAARMVADVPLGAFLSGGIDSSLVVAKMARLSGQRVRTFTIGFAEKEYDESSHAAAVAAHLGTEHHCEQLKVDDLLELMPLFTEEYDEPFFDSSAFPTMAVSRLARRHVTVSLSGDGGDELFGGYHYYRIADQLAPFFALPAPLRHLAAAAANLLPAHQTKLLAAVLREPDNSAAFAFARSIAKDFDGLLLPEAEVGTEDMRQLFTRLARPFPPGLAAGEAGARLDALLTLPDDYLQKVDMGSMAFSLEAREPLLDTALIEWAMRLPWQWKRRAGVGKYLLRQLAYRYVPREILDRPKQGFRVPIDHWLRGPLAGWANALLHERRLFEHVPLSQKRAIDLFKLHSSGARNVSPLLWALLMLLNYADHSIAPKGVA